MVVTNAVDVVEDQTHAPTTPLLVLPAELAHPLLDALGEEPALDVLPGVGGVVDENLTQTSVKATVQPPFLRAAGIEVCRRHTPDP